MNVQLSTKSELQSSRGEVIKKKIHRTINESKPQYSNNTFSSAHRTSIINNEKIISSRYQGNASLNYCSPTQVDDLKNRSI